MEIDLTPAHRIRTNVPAWPLQILGFIAELLFPEGNVEASARASLRGSEAFVELTLSSAKGASGDSVPPPADTDLDA